MTEQILVEESWVMKTFFTNPRLSWFWVVVRVYLGWEWLSAGWEKIMNPLWVGWDAGAPLRGFIAGALTKTNGVHPDVQGWYAFFLENVVLPHANLWSHMVAYGEVLVGLGLIVGAFTALAAFFGLFMNLNYLLAGTVSVNPILFTLAIFVIFSRSVTRKFGLDYFLEPILQKYYKRPLW